ncbi:alginate lyase family protein [Joostella sp.]|uniref:alginate lyase family protein n=1 Tax=Joostella sp. TaxID=2231138 RepID=UPI003A8CB5A6
MKKVNNNFLIVLICVVFSNCIYAQKQFSTEEHPSLILTKQGVASIKKELGNLPLFDATLKETKEEVDADMATGIHVPIPKDMAGGYTHERHKKNFYILQKAGVLFQILGDKKYAEFTKDVLFEYAKIYKGLPLHPEERSYSRGKIFWQCLNDANWLVYMSQAYDSIYDWLSEEDRDYLESELFIPFADFLSIENPKFFNRIHNHSTWGNAAVGMIGLAMRDTTLVNRALYGLDTENLDLSEKDNDGGTIFDAGGKAGFMANLYEAFSPSGYYTEGPYYQRYAMYPFMVFAEGLYNTGWDKDIFKFKDNVLIKAVSALVQLTDSEGDFFPLNDAQKGMSYYTGAMINAVDIAYYYGDQDPSLLEIAKKQQSVTLSSAGLAVAKGVAEGDFTSSIRKSIELLDGPKGNQGGISILRPLQSKTPMSLVVKYTSQGSSHGHYDKLSFSLYSDGDEIIQDYGLARFVNIDQKNGGGYLKENTTWAKQTIAHNTIVQDEKSHFNGDYGTGSKYNPLKYFSDFSNDNIQIVSVKDSNAYQGTKLHRTMALVNIDGIENPLTIDIFKVSSEEKHQFDLPYYFFGQIISTDFKMDSFSSLTPFGTDNGYQHLYKEASGSSNKETASFSWLSNNKFYTLTSSTSEKEKLFFTRLGAKDPEFNLRRDPGFVIRKNNTDNAIFASVIEKHGGYNAVTEKASNAFSSIKAIEVLPSDKAYTVVKIRTITDKIVVLAIANNDAEVKEKHSIKINGTDLSWKGPYYLLIK